MMASDPRTDVVAQQYRKWQYPEPIQDLEAWTVDNWEWFDPSHAHRVFWPDRPYQPDLDILSAGCGTNQASVIAYNNPSSKVVGIDISQESLDHGYYLKEKHQLKNLELYLLPIEEVESLNRNFDLIMCSGVLHHMASPQQGMNSLAGVLRSEGVAAIMVYARYGRIGVEIMQSVFRDIGLRQDDQSLELVKVGINSLDVTHPVKAYIDVAPDLAYDAGVVDTFLHGRDRSFTVQDCIELVEASGLVLQDWFTKSPLYPPVLVEPENPFFETINRLPQRQIWSVMERLRNQTACHLFLACRPERPVERYQIDFTSNVAASYVPLWRYQAGFSTPNLYRNNWSITPDSAVLGLIELIDGERSIQEIASLIPRADNTTTKAEHLRTAVDLIQQLWRFDFLSIAL